MTGLLALLLVMGLPWVETNVTITGRAALQCHVCEEFDSIKCSNPTNCPGDSAYCATVVVRMLVRFIYVTRQCTKYCPVIHPNEIVVKSFVLEKPTPFLYASCCRTSLCNIHSPQINDTEGNYRQMRRAGAPWSSRAGLLSVLTFASALLVLIPP